MGVVSAMSECPGDGSADPAGRVESPAASRSMADDDHHEAEERAAIRQFDGGVSRSEAERATAEELAREGLVVPDWPPS